MNFMYTVRRLVQNSAHIDHTLNFISSEQYHSFNTQAIRHTINFIIAMCVDLVIG